MAVFSGQVAVLRPLQGVKCGYIFYPFPRNLVLRETSEPLNKLFDGVLREDPKKAWHWSAKITGHTI